MMVPLRSFVPLLVGCLLIAQEARAEEPTALPRQTLEAIQLMAIQHNGRFKPFDSFARETLQAITGADHIGRAECVETILSLIAEPEQWEDAPLISVPFKPLREPLGLNPAASHASYNQLVATRKLMRLLPPIVAKQQRDEKLTVLENETLDAFQRFVALSALLEQKLELVPPAMGSGSWLPIVQPEGYPPSQRQALRGQWTALLRAVRSRQPQAIEAAGRQLASTLEQANPAAYPPRWRREWEVRYNHLRPFRVVRLLYWLAFVVLMVGLIAQRDPLNRWGLTVLGAGAGAHAAGILLRVILGGRPPVSNFFETMLWLPFVAVVVGLVLERVYRARYVGLAAALLAAIVLTLADVVPLDSSLVPPVAVLRSNLWLTVHVLTIVASYGALALAAALAHVYGIAYLLPRQAKRTLASMDTLLYRILQVGVVLLATGIMLGAVWANASWGRYWGWDPKETWALITLLWFLAVLHGRFAGWLRGVGVALSTIAGFFLLLMTYYGVSFYLVGLHSYAGGHAKPLPPLLIAYLVAECAFLALVGLTASTRRLRAP